MARWYSKALASWLATGLLTLVPVFGCVTAPPAEDEEHKIKRAASHFNLAADHADNGRLEFALRDLLAAERLSPGDPRIQHSLGIVYLQKGKVPEAVEHLEAYVASNPANAQYAAIAQGLIEALKQ